MIIPNVFDPPRRMRLLDLREAVAFYDPGSRLNGTPTCDNTGITVPLLGSWGSTSPKDWPRWVFRARDLFGVQPDENAIWNLQGLIEEVTAPGTSSDYAICVGLISHDQPDVAQPTGYGQFVGTIYNSTNRRPHAAWVTAGAHGGTNTGVNHASARHTAFLHSRAGVGAGHTALVGSAVTARSDVTGLDSAYGGLGTYTGCTTAAIYGADPYVCLAVGRYSAVVGAETAKFKVHLHVAPMVLQ
jgi:hypothetical protein